MIRPRVGEAKRVVVVASLTIKRCIVRFLYYVLLTPQKDGGEITRQVKHCYKKPCEHRNEFVGDSSARKANFGNLESLNGKP